jgi:hypothetical protein
MNNRLFFRCPLSGRLQTHEKHLWRRTIDPKLGGWRVIPFGDDARGDRHDDVCEGALYYCDGAAGAAPSLPETEGHA